MRLGFVIGTAATGAFLTFVAAVLGAVAAGVQNSVPAGVITRSVLVVLALALTTALWRARLRPADSRASVLVGLVLAWLINIGNLTGSVFLGRLFTTNVPVTVIIDLVLWMLVSYGLARGLVRSSPVTAR